MATPKNLVLILLLFVSILTHCTSNTLVTIDPFLFTPDINQSVPSETILNFLHGPSLLARLTNSKFNGILQEKPLSSNCVKHVMEFAEQLHQVEEHPEKLLDGIEPWALQMLDAWGKVPEGILSGHIAALGDFDECLAIEGSTDQNGEPMFIGKYCVQFLMPTFGNISMPEDFIPDQVHPGERSVKNLLKTLAILGKTELKIMPSIGSCLPSTCSDDESLQVASAILKPSGLQPVASICRTVKRPKLDAGAIGMITYLVILTTIVVSGTLFHVGLQYMYIPGDWGDTKLGSYMKGVSMITNGSMLISTTSNNPNEIKCLHGIRFFCACWIVIGHTFMMTVLQPLWNLIDLYSKYLTTTKAMFLTNSIIVVDIFFVMGGFLIPVSILPKLEGRRGVLAIVLVIVRRYLMLTPVYMTILLFGAYLFPLLGTGPYWHIAETWSLSCRKNWWKNVLYINNLQVYNLDDPEDIPCHGVTYYLGVHMQLLVISPFLLYPVWKWKKYGVAFPVLITIVAIFTPGVITYVNDLQPIGLPFNMFDEYFSLRGYMPTYMRASPYLIGMLVGIYFHRIHHKKFHMKTSSVIVGWMLALGLALAVFFPPKKFADREATLNTFESAAWVAGSKVSWALSISWLIFACATGHGGWVNRILSWRPFVPLGRLTLSMYLLAMFLQMFYHSQSRVHIYFSDFHLFNLALGHVVMSSLFSVVCVLLVQAPFMQIAHLLFSESSNISEKGNKVKSQI